jgi:hypothetical protein
MVDQAQAKGIKVMLLTSTPIGEEENGNNQKLAAYNDFLRQLAKDRNLPLADLNADFHAYYGKNAPKEFLRRLTVDGVHMNSEGNVIMAEGILKAFGVPAPDIAKIDASWVDLPNSAHLNPSVNNPQILVTLRQYRALEKIALARGVDVPYIINQLWVQSVNQIYLQHPHDDIAIYEFEPNSEELFKKSVAELIQKEGGR